MKFVNAKVMLDEELTFDKANEALLALGYCWLHGSTLPSPMPTNVNCIVTHVDGQLKYAVFYRRSFDWKTHPGFPATIKDGVIEPLPWERGDPGRAPNSYVFSDTPPTKEECPDGYITSACGKFFQSSNALLYNGGVRIVLKPTLFTE